MSFSYDPDQLSEPLNHLRFLVQDTTDAGHFFEDSEITFAATQETNIYRAAASLCRSIATQILKDAGFDNDQIDYDPEAKAKMYRELAADYSEKADRTDSSMNTGAGASGLNLPTLSTADPAFTRSLDL